MKMYKRFPTDKESRLHRSRSMREASVADGRSQSQVAATIGIQQSLLNRYINGDIEPGVAMAARIAVEYGLPVERFWSSLINTVSESRGYQSAAAPRRAGASS